jgi:hypothetical protein
VARKLHTENLIPFKEGYDKRRNLKGRPKKVPEINEILIKVLNEKQGGMNTAEAMVRAQVIKAINHSDTKAFAEIRDMAYGKPKLVIQHSGSIELPDIDFSKLSEDEVLEFIKLKNKAKNEKEK